MTDSPPPPTESDVPYDAHHHPGTRRPAAGRIPPHDLDAEASLLGAMLLRADAITAGRKQGLSAEDFYSPTHGHVWRACVALNDNGDPADIVTVASQLDADGVLDHIGGKAYLVELQAGTPTISNAAKYAAIVANHAHRRRIIGFAGAVAELGYEHHSDDLEALSSSVLSTFDRLVADRHRGDTNPDPWTPELLGGERREPEAPYACLRDDGPALLYMARTNEFHGTHESGKTFLAHVAVTQLAQRGAHSVIVDLEDSKAGAENRLYQLGLTSEQMREFVHYFAPDVDLSGALPAIRKLDVPVDLIVIDSASEAVVAAGGSINDNDDNTRFGRTLRSLARETGAAVLYIDHVTKTHETGSRYSLGGGAKPRFIDGAMYELHVINRFGPGRTGTAKIYNTKDRHGGVVGHCVKDGKKDLAGVFEIESDTDGTIIDWGIRPPTHHDATGADGSWRPTGFMERISRWLELNPGTHTRNAVGRALRGSREHKDLALQLLADEGYIDATPGARNSTNYSHIKPYRETTAPLEERVAA